MAKVSVDKEKCIGCGNCEAVAPEIFVLKGSMSVVRKASVTGEDEKKAKEARDSCPTGAIILK
ncbi:MAG: ferredoxin [archaeon]